MIQIGSQNWVDRLFEATAPLGRDFWSGFTPAKKQELAHLESQIRRKLPAEFREFYLSVGYGSFPQGGGFDSPEEIFMELGASIYFVLGSLTPGAEWATEEEHKELWITRGGANLDTSRFDDSMLFGGVYLYDLLQFGSDGCCCYHHLYVGPEPAPFRYCLLTDYQTMENKKANFSGAIESVIEFYNQTT